MAGADPAHTSPEARIYVVERDVAGLKEGMVSLSATVNAGFDKLNTKLETKSAPNWQMIGLVLGAMLTISGWGFSLFGNFQSRTDAALSDIKQTFQTAQVEQKQLVAKFISRDEVVDRLNFVKDRRDAERATADARMARIERDADEMDKRIVPRGEHVEQWNHQRSKDDAIQRQVDELRKTVVDLNSPRDTVQQILQRLRDLESHK